MLTVLEVAQRVGRDPETVRRWIRSGKLPATKVGLQHMVAEDHLPLPDDDDALVVGGDRPVVTPDGTTITMSTIIRAIHAVRETADSHRVTSRWPCALGCRW